MCFFFAQILFESLISDSLSFAETRFLKVIKVSDGTILLQLVPNTFNGVYIKPDEDGECLEPVEFSFNSFEKTLDKDSREFFFREGLCDVFIIHLTEYQENFHYVYEKIHVPAHKFKTNSESHDFPTLKK